MVDQAMGRERGGSLDESVADRLPNLSDSERKTLTSALTYDDLNTNPDGSTPGLFSKMVDFIVNDRAQRAEKLAAIQASNERVTQQVMGVSQDKPDTDKLL